MRYAHDYLKKIKYNEGFSFLEVISGLFIFSLVVLVVYSSFQAGIKSLNQSKHRVAAAALANEKMEIIRNMTYNSIGAQGGVPTGSLSQNETVWRSNQKFNVHTFVRYVDDPQDGLGAEDENHVLTDYKEAKVEVTWPGVSTGHGVKVVSKFVPNGVESDIGGGTLRFNALDGSGASIPGVSVHIVNGSVSPAVDIDTYTDSSGTVLLSGMPAGDRNYEITVSKDGYENVATMPPYPTTPYEPTDTHASVIEGALNGKAIIIDKLSSIHVWAKNFYDEALPNMNFNLKGGRVIGKVPVTNEEVTNYDQDFSTGETGDVSAADLPPGKYSVTLDQAGYTVVGSDISLPVPLSPDQNIDLNLIIVSNSLNSLIASVTDSVSGLPISNASVHLYNGVDFDVTLVTGEAGQVYFPPNTDPPTILNSGEYTLGVTADQHDPYSGSVNISQLTQSAVELNPISP